MTTATGMCRDRPRLRACFRAALTLILWWGLGQTAWAATPPNAANAPLRVGLVLGGGGARGLAHLGIIDELEKLHIPISCIAGTSAGALVGGIYATGADVTELIQKVKTADWNSLLSGAPDRRKLPYLRKIDDNKNLSSPTIGLTADGLSVGRSLVGSQRIDRFLRELTGGLTSESFQSLPIPFVAIATDLETGDLVEFHSGDLATALRASMAVPGVFDVVDDEGRLLIDGMFARNLPIENLKGGCADIVIAVDVGMPTLKRDEIRSLLDVANQTLNVMTGKNVVASRRLLDERDILIEPQLDGFTPASFTDAAAIIERGRAAATAVAARLSTLAVADGSYRAWKQSLQARATAVIPPPVDMRISSTTHFPQPLIQKVIEGDHPPASQEDLEQRIELLFNTGDFDTIGYRYSLSATPPVTEVRVAERGVGPNRLRLGVGIEIDSYRTSNVALLANYQMAWLTERGTRWKNDIRVGNNSELVSELYQPLWPSALIGSVRGYIRNVKFPVYNTVGANLGDLDVRTAGAEAGVGYTFGEYGELRSYAFLSDVQTSVLSGLSKYKADGGARLYGYSIRGAVDQFDNPRWPRNGYRGEINSFWVKSSDSGEPSMTMGALDVDLAQSFGELTARSSLQMRATSAPYARFGQINQLGGFLRLSGLETGRIAAAETFFGRLMLYHRVSALLPQLGSGTYMGGSLEVGKAKGLLSGDVMPRVIPAASVFVGADTFIGPLYFAIGNANYHGSNWAGYIYLGYQP